MLKNVRDPREAREAMLSLLSTSGTHLGAARTRRMLQAIDILFLGSMTLMVLAGFIVVYALM